MFAQNLSSNASREYLLNYRPSTAEYRVKHFFNFLMPQFEDVRTERAYAEEVASFNSSQVVIVTHLLGVFAAFPLLVVAANMVLYAAPLSEFYVPLAFVFSVIVIICVIRATPARCRGERPAKPSRAAS